jgi:hypothetical protein
MVQDAGTMLAGLGSSRTPWLTVALAGPADPHVPGTATG